MKDMKVIRGQYMECCITPRQSSTPVITIKYGNGRSPFHTYDEAEIFALSLLKLPELKTALTAVKELFDGDRDDCDTVVELIENVLEL